MLSDTDTTNYVIFDLAGQSFGIEVDIVQDVLKTEKVTPVPLAPQEVLGVINMRGRIATVVDLARCLGRAGDERECDRGKCIVVEHGSDLYALRVDDTHDVYALSDDGMAPLPRTMSATDRTAPIRGLFNREDGAILILDLDRALDFAVGKADVRE